MAEMLVDRTRVRKPHQTEGYKIGRVADYHHRTMSYEHVEACNKMSRRRIRSAWNRERIGGAGCENR
jgi:hypothetical protein